MASSCRWLVLPVLLFTYGACGGGIAPGTDKQTPTGSSGEGSGSGGGASGTGNGGSGSGTDQTAPARCTPGAYVFCRCPDRSEGTKLCRGDGTFDACSCEVSCSYPAPTTPLGCPATYSHAYSGQPCDTPDLHCLYPGQGDGDSNGCASTAGLTCRDEPGGARWVATQ